MNSKVFSQRFNREWASLEYPEDPIGKTNAIVKVFGVSRRVANQIICGSTLPTPSDLNKIAALLEVCPQWLCGLTDRKKAYSAKEALLEG